MAQAKLAKLKPVALLNFHFCIILLMYLIRVFVSSAAVCTTTCSDFPVSIQWSVSIPILGVIIFLLLKANRIRGFGNTCRRDAL